MDEWATEISDENKRLIYQQAMQGCIWQSKVVAEITLCGSLKFTINESQNFIKPTPEQIKNLHNMLCIDVKLIGE